MSDPKPPKERKSAPRRKASSSAKRKPGNKPPGRVPKLLKDPKLMANICAAVRMGATFKDAAVANGIHESTLYDWLDKASKEGTHICYSEFAEQLQRARAEGQAALVSIIHRAAAGDAIFDDAGNIIGYRNRDWRAASHLLALRDPENYSIRHKLEHSGDAGGPIGFQVYLPEREDEP
jgi:hypothetical protein